MFNIIVSIIISCNGYINHHIELSIFMISSNIINGIYYFLLRNSIYNIFGKANDTQTITHHLKMIHGTTKTDIFINLSVLVIVTTFFILWINEKYGTDRILLIIEYSLNTLISLFSLYVCYVNMKQLRQLFSIDNYQKTYNSEFNDHSAISNV